ncbi:PREDICTED: profilin-4-like isoform X1 [Branchiostoma belcheri]|uniref:Profilin n=2 Tax=Branchiostoma belcheri TaxID=7741 RepID=A0A6P5A7L1_BRABE|nr:PREDICTED: profilin-4-like isoform X1 [Branchiostoma belcheri]
MDPGPDTIFHLGCTTSVQLQTCPSCVCREASLGVDNISPPKDKVKMNQLQNLLHDALISTEHVEHCCILRRKDVSLRASSVGFTLYQDQIQMFVDAFKNPPQTREDGLYFEDRHYKCVRADKNAVYAKCGKRGLVIVRTGSLLIVGTYNDNMYPSVCVEAVEKLADYFKEKGK